MCLFKKWMNIIPRVARFHFQILKVVSCEGSSRAFNADSLEITGEDVEVFGDDGDKLSQFENGVHVREFTAEVFRLCDPFYLRHGVYKVHIFLHQFFHEHRIMQQGCWVWRQRFQ